MPSSRTVRLLAGSIIAPALLVWLDVSLGDGLGTNAGMYFGLVVGGLNLALGNLGFWSKPLVIIAYCVLGSVASFYWQLAVEGVDTVIASRRAANG